MEPLFTFESIKEKKHIKAYQARDQVFKFQAERGEEGSYPISPALDPLAHIRSQLSDGDYKDVKTIRCFPVYLFELVLSLVLSRGLAQMSTHRLSSQAAGVWVTPFT